MPSSSSSCSSCSSSFSSSSSKTTGLIIGEEKTPRITKKFEKGQTVYLECYFRNMLSQLENPTNPSWKIFNNKGEIVTSGVPVQRETGVYYFFWTSDITGDLLVEFKGNLTTYSVAHRRKIKIIETEAENKFCSSSSSYSSSSSSSSSSSRSSSSSSSSSHSFSSSCSSSFSSLSSSSSS